MSSDSSNSPNSRPTDPSGAQPAQRPTGPQPPRRRNWSDLVEEILNEARARGDFDNLPGKGKPLRLDDDSAAGDKALAYRLLKNNNAVPPEIERGREIDAELARAEDLLATLRRRREGLLARAGAAERRLYNQLCDKTEAQYRDALRAANSRVLSLNIVAPAALHRPTIPVEAKMRAFADEFPRLEE
jgi:DnaJ homolog subfamily C member 28